jgi:hypothetical protein
MVPEIQQLSCSLITNTESVTMTREQKLNSIYNKMLERERARKVAKEKQRQLELCLIIKTESALTL